MARGTCAHGKYPGNSYGDITVHGGDERKVERHEAKCKGAHLFWHDGLLFKVVCCATCGKKVL